MAVKTEPGLQANLQKDRTLTTFGLLIGENIIESVLAPDKSKAFTAVNGTIRFWLEGNTGFLAAPCTYCSEIFSWAAGCTLACITAGFAALRLILKALLSIKSLFAGSKDKLLTAVLANKRLILVHGVDPLFIRISTAQWDRNASQLSSALCDQLLLESPCDLWRESFLRTRWTALSTDLIGRPACREISE